MKAHYVPIIFACAILALCAHPSLTAVLIVGLTIGAIFAYLPNEE